MARRVPPNSCPRPGAVRFFQENAGASHRIGEDPRHGRKRSARRLAVAECWADRVGAEVSWEPDIEPYDPGDTDYQAEEVYCAVLKSANGGVLESLCGIADPDRNYRRVVEAELAFEAFYAPVQEIERRIQAGRGRPVLLGLNGRRSR